MLRKTEEEIKLKKAEKKKAKRKAKTVEKAEKKKSHKSKEIPQTIITTTSEIHTTGKKGRGINGHTFSARR